MFVHSFFCTSVLGAFYVFLLIDCFIRQESHGTGTVEQESVGDRTILFLLSLPFLAIFIIGCHSLYLLSMVMDEVKARKKEQGQPHHQLVEMSSQRTQQNERGSIADDFELLQLPDNVDDNNFCVICLVQQRDSIFYPCGHECVCQPCG